MLDSLMINYMTPRESVCQVFAVMRPGTTDSSLSSLVSFFTSELTWYKTLGQLFTHQTHLSFNSRCH